MPLSALVRVRRARPIKLNHHSAITSEFIYSSAYVKRSILPFSLPTYSGSGRRIEMGAREKDDRNKGKKFFAIHSSLVHALAAVFDVSFYE